MVFARIKYIIKAGIAAMIMGITSSILINLVLSAKYMLWASGKTIAYTTLAAIPAMGLVLAAK
jgi:hypothetical protein